MRAGTRRAYHFLIPGLAGVTLCGRTVRQAFDIKRPWLVTCKQCRSRMPQDLRDQKAPMVQRINLMSGLPYMEAEDTPNYCSPASEAYWSM